MNTTQQEENLVWFVDLEGDTEVLSSLAATFKEPAITVKQANNDFFLTSTAFNGSDEQAKQIVRSISGALTLAGLPPVRVVGSIGTLSADGFRMRTSKIDGRLRLLPSDWTPEQEEALRQKEELERQQGEARRQQEKVSQEATRRSQLENILCKVITAQADEDVAEVLRLIDTTCCSWTNLYKVYEIIRGNKRNKENKKNKIIEKGWATETQLDRFTRTANHQASSGEDARHARSTDVPVANPMSITEANRFIRNIIEEWIKDKQVR